MHDVGIIQVCDARFAHNIGSECMPAGNFGNNLSFGSIQRGIAQALQGGNKFAHHGLVLVVEVLLVGNVIVEVLCRVHLETIRQGSPGDSHECAGILIGSNGQRAGSTYRHILVVKDWYSNIPSGAVESYPLQLIGKNSAGCVALALEGIENTGLLNSDFVFAQVRRYAAILNKCAY